jgi:hypothetical protein
MGEIPQIQVCQACSVIPIYLTKVLQQSTEYYYYYIKGSEYICKCDISGFILNKFANISKNLFLLCIYGVFCVDLKVDEGNKPFNTF